MSDPVSAAGFRAMVVASSVSSGEEDGRPSFAAPGAGVVVPAMTDDNEYMMLIVTLDADNSVRLAPPGWIPLLEQNGPSGRHTYCYGKAAAVTDRGRQVWVGTEYFGRVDLVLGVVAAVPLPVEGTIRAAAHDRAEAWISGKWQAMPGTAQGWRNIHPDGRLYGE